MGKKLVVYGVDYSENAIEKDLSWGVHEIVNFANSTGTKQVDLARPIVAGTNTRLNVVSVDNNGGGLYFGVIYDDGVVENNVWGKYAVETTTITSEFVCPKNIIAITLWTSKSATATVELQVFG